MGNQGCCVQQNEASGEPIVAQMVKTVPQFQAVGEPTNGDKEVAHKEIHEGLTQFAAAYVQDKVETKAGHQTAEEASEDQVAGYTLVLTFRLPDGTEKAFGFTERPLGIDFNRYRPVTVINVKPGSSAEAQGVQVDQVLIKVAGVPCEDKVPAEIQQLLLSTTTPLRSRS